ncbi:MAG: hypothetical protein C0518_05070 [Opitutus sp.]|nr:hypothetical protein [Opitutus sp.]
MAGTRYLTHAEERAVMDVARRRPARDHLFIALQLWAGLRASEALLLKVGDLWVEGAAVKELVVKRHAHNRNYAPTRLVPLSAEVQRAIRRLVVSIMAEGGQVDPEAWVFTSLSSRPLQAAPIDRRSAHRLVQRVLAAAKIDDDGRLGTHLLRKTFAYRLFVLSRRNLILVREALGHASVQTTDEYIESRREAVESAILRGDSHYKA